MNEQELREQIAENLENELEITENIKFIFTLMLKAVEGTRLTDEQISQAKADYANGTMDAGYKAEHFKQKNWGEAAILTAQLEAVKKVFGGVK